MRRSLVGAEMCIRDRAIGLNNKRVLNAPNIDNSDFIEFINQLRAQGHIIRTDLKGSNEVDFVNENGKWKLKE